MAGEWRQLGGWGRRRRQNRVKPGDGHALKSFRWWQLLHRSLFFLELEDSALEDAEAEGAGLEEPERRRTYAVSLNHFDLDEKIHLYLNGRHEAVSTAPASFPVPGGSIEAAISAYGVRRMHFVPEDGGPARLLTPEADSGEGRRARFDAAHPAASRRLGLLSVLMLVIALLLGLPQVAEAVSSIDVVADTVGTFDSPVNLPAWANTAMTLAAVLASYERALRIQHNWLLDGGGFDL